MKALSFINFCLDYLAGQKRRGWLGFFSALISVALNRLPLMKRHEQLVCVLLNV